MKLYATDESEMMYVSKIDGDSSRLLITGTIMGAMPIEVVLTGAELRKIFPLLNFKVIWTAIRMLITG